MNTTSGNNCDPSRSLIDLDNSRKALEAEAQAITDELTQPVIDGDGKKSKPMGVNTPLVDEEGYPRSDIDIYRARGLRQRLNEIKYDHKLIMKQIESKLSANGSTHGTAVSSSSSSMTESIKMSEEELKARLAQKPKPKFDKKTGKWVVCNWDGTVAGVENGHLRKFDKLDEDINQNVMDVDRSQNLPGYNTNNSTIESSLASSCVISDETVERKPFAKVNEIFDNSPAAMGGLKLHDAIIQIGSVNETNNRDLQAVADVVYRSFQSNESLQFIIMRQTNEGPTKLQLQVKPGVWEGNGVLGCRIVKP